MLAVKEPAIPPRDAVIWRYMEKSKFEHLLQPCLEVGKWPGKQNKENVTKPGQIWFSYPRYLAKGSGGAEGELPKKNCDLEAYCNYMADVLCITPEEALLAKKRLLENGPKVRETVELMAQMCGISSWQESIVVDPEMWYRFAGDEGIAIRSTCQAVLDGISNAWNSLVTKARVAACSVGYVDYSRYILQADGYYALLSLVSQTWSDENEIRFVARSATLANIYPRISRQTATTLSERLDNALYTIRQSFRALEVTQEEGFSIPIDLSFIQEVVVSPSIDTGTLKRWRDLLDCLDLQDIVIRHSNYC